MSTKGKLLRRLRSVAVLRDKPGGITTALNDAAASAGDTTITVDSDAGMVAGQRFRIGDGETIESVEVSSVAGNVVTLVNPLALDHDDNDAFVQQLAYDLGDVKGSVDLNQTLETTDLQSSMRRLVFQTIEGFMTTAFGFTVFGFTMEVFCAAMGIPFASINGTGASSASPKSLATDFNDVDSVQNVCLLATAILQDGSIKTYEAWGVYADYSSWQAQLAMGQDGAVPMKFGCFGTLVEQDGAPTVTLDTSVKAGKGKVPAELTGVGLWVEHDTPAATSLAADVAAGASSVVVADATGYDAEDWMALGEEGSGEEETHWIASVANGLRVDGNLAISATAEEFKTTQTAKYAIAGVEYSKVATDNLTFSAAHVVNATKFGIVLVQINAAGAISTKVPASPQTYNNAGLALAAKPAPDAGNVELGYITIAAGAGNWTANTDDMTNGSDLTTAGFVDGSTTAGNTITLKTLVLRAHSSGDDVVRIQQSPFAAITREGAQISVSGSTTAIQNGLRRLPIGAQPGFVNAQLSIGLLALTLENRARALGIDPSEIANSRLIMTENVGRARIIAGYAQGVLKDSSVYLVNMWGLAQELANVATQFGNDPNAASIPFVGKPTSGIQFVQYAA